MKNPVKALVLAVVVLTVGVGVVLLDQDGGEGPGLPFEEGVQAAAADELVASIGVNTHLSYDTTAYDDFESVERALVDLGVRHIRDYPVPQNVEEINELAAEGISFTAIMGTPVERPWMPLTLEQLYEVVRDDIPGAVAAVEGANEWDISDEEDWAEQLRTHQEALWDLMGDDERTRDIPVVAPSITWDYNMEEAGDLSEWADLGNVHPYPGGEQPEERVAEDIEAARENNAGDVPVLATETGYHNAVPRGGRGHPGVTEEVAATYLPQLFLHYFSLGVPRTFSYELVDQVDDPGDREASFGLLHDDFTPKPAYTAMQDLIGMLEDPGPAFSPGRLDYRVEGGDDDTRHLLFQKRDGTFHLAIWQASTIWDADDQEPVKASNRSVTIELAQPIAEARVRTVGGDGGGAAPLEAPTSVDVEVSPTVQVVELVPDQVNASS